MALQNTDQLQHLKSAFQTFNQMSEQLMSSYHQLETQVERLNQELAVVHGDCSQQSEQNRHLVNRLERLLNALPGGVIVLDGKGMVQVANAAASELLGEPLKGEIWREVIQRVFGPRADDGHDISLKDGRRVSISTSSLGTEPGQILLITDVTEKRRLQDKLGRYQRLSAMGQMAASLAHQIRTPAASALLYLSNLKRNQTNPDVVLKYSDKVREQLRNIEAMVSDMLAYARGDDDLQATTFTTQNLVEALNQSVSAQFEKSGHSLRLINQVPDLNLKGNREAILGALINLAMNSMHAAGSGPLVATITMSRQDGNNILISVEDNGIGIPTEIMKNVFDPFVTTRPQGTGLGLAVVKSVIEKHGGSVALTSEEGKGTHVSIIFPIHIDSQSEKSNREAVNNEVWL